MSKLHAQIASLFLALPEECELAVLNNAPHRVECEAPAKYTKHEWTATMRPYAASVLWLALKLTVAGPEAAKDAYLKLSADRRALVRIGYEIVFESKYPFEVGYTYRRPRMFVEVDVKQGEFPVRTLANMRLGTYVRLTNMGEVAA
ncbi:MULTISPECIES: hypothetical protein [Paraburkholderia]|uniref:hypothetical protein n=1 Tax=Paraburkholderia TaxID=1822464 RepID=UPI000360121C|nr:MULTISPECIES: hypothetical protein [Paraburkholderia]MDH6149341.1 hypothetical protein [Paraburkholderia sp. WSM4179]